MPAKQHLNFHGTVSTFVCRFHSSLNGAHVLALPTPSTPRTVLLTTRERGINADKKRVDLDVCLCGRRQGATDDVSSQQLHQLVEPRSPHQHSWHPCLSSSSCAPATGAVLNSCDTVSCRKVSLFSLVICVPSRAIVSNSFVSTALRRVNARNTARMISLTSALSTAFTSVSWVRAAWLCDSAAVSSLPKVVTDVAFSSIWW